MNSQRPDLSNFLAHFTRDGDPYGGTDQEGAEDFATMDARERLIAILKSGVIKATSMPWVNQNASCFTECPWSSMIDHATHYSSYGVGFTKPHVFAAGGGPVYYVRADHYQKQQWDGHVQTFVTPFWPHYRPAHLKSDEHLKGKTIDYSHEREWRVPHDFTFSLDEVQFLILPTYEEMATFPKELKDAIGREKFLLMEVYRNIERLWPVHNLDV